MKVTLNTTGACRNIQAGHLKMGGTNPQSVEISANSLHFTIGGKPVLPVMGEMQYSRYPRRYWEQSILKMKACGVQIIATYIFWIYHEEIQGQWDWTGDKDLRHFVELCDKHRVYMYPRIGPWCHGECRNGGFPDWIWEMPNKRTDDPIYLSHVERLFAEIFKQLKGLLYSDGGPVIGVQLENEYWFGEAGEKHMMTLKNMAKEAGIDVPLYTATGWKNGSIPCDEIIPVFGGYPANPWEIHVKKLPLCPDYFFLQIRNNEEISTNLRPKATGYDVDFSRYPYATCEIGSGIQITYHRRPVLSRDDVCALSLVKIGSGSNMVGYYMFHGGTNPNGKLTTMQEVYGRPYKLEYPVKSCDFQAPIREFGQISESYSGFKILHLFLNDFGELLAPMVTALPKKRPTNVNDTTTLRFAARVKDDAGFLFFNNYQRHADMQNFENCRIELKLKNETLTLPEKPFTLKKGKYFIWPFNMNMAGALLKYATSQLLCKLCDSEAETYFFFAIPDILPQYAFDSTTVKHIRVSSGRINKTDGRIHVSGLKPGIDCVLELVTPAGNKLNMVTLTQEQAEQCWKGHIWDRQRVFLTESNLLFDEQKLRVYGTNPQQMSFCVYPKPQKKLFEGTSELAYENKGLFTAYKVCRAEKDVQLTVKNISHKSASFKWSVQIPADALDEISDLFLRIYYEGDTAKAMLDGELIPDNFYNGQPWEIGLKRFAPKVLGNEIILEVIPMRENAVVYLEEWVKRQDCKTPKIQKIQAEPEYEVIVEQAKEPSP